MTKLSHLKFIFLLALCLLAGGAFASRAEAASFSFVTSSSLVHEGEEIAVDIVVDPEGQNVNTVSATIDLPSNLTFIDSDDSSSVIGLWVDQPTYNPATDTFSLSGIVPGGFSGLIDPFSTGVHKSGGTILRLYFKGATPDVGTFSFAAADAYLNDALGTEAQVATKPLSIVVDDLLGESTLASSTDTDPPLPFTPVLERDLLLYDGKYVLIFNTKDKVSGISHYEVKEGNGPWVIATSPYVLEDQTVSGDITVKAFDRAGNVQTEIVPGLRHFASAPVLLGAGILAGALIVFFLEKRKKRPVVYSADAAHP